MGISGSSNDLLSDHSLLEAVIIEMFFFLLTLQGMDYTQPGYVNLFFIHQKRDFFFFFFFAKIVPESTKLVNLQYVKKTWQS